MQYQEVRHQLAIYRELSAAEQDQVQQHMAGCPACAATWNVYQAQDRALSALPVITPSLRLATAVRARTVDRRRPPQRLTWGWATAVALSLFLFFGLVGGTVSVAADALPGDTLYPVKRTAEQVRLALTVDDDARNRYQNQLARIRRQEAQAVIRLERQAKVQFQGRLEAVADDIWIVEGLAVKVTPTVWPGTPPPLGSIVFVEAQAAKGQLVALRVQVLQLAPPPATPPPSPTSMPSPTPSLTATETRAATPTPEPTTRRDEEPRPTPTPDEDLLLRPRLTRTPRPRPRPDDRPGPAPTERPRPGDGPGPGPAPTEHPRPGDGPGPGPAPTEHPRPGDGPGPGPAPTEHPRPGDGPGPGPAPTERPRPDDRHDQGSASNGVSDSEPEAEPTAPPPERPHRRRDGPRN